jgi:hypothetical protein
MSEMVQFMRLEEKMADRGKRAPQSREQKKINTQRIVFSIFAIVIILSWILSLLVQ